MYAQLPQLISKHYFYVPLHGLCFFSPCLNAQYGLTSQTQGKSKECDFKIYHGLPVTL